MTARRATRSPQFHAVVLAGGGGTRFWPWSRGRQPKQFLALTGAEPLVVESWRRVSRLTERDRVWVVAPAALASRVRSELPELRPSRLIVEPSPRDTAAAIALACARIARVDPEGIVGIFPSDHVVSDASAFRRSVREAIRVARQGKLVCLAVPPGRPATGFGYLRCARVPAGPVAVPVERFVEKPDAARARRFVRSGRYLWNAGMFLWSARRFLDELSHSAPAIRKGVEAHLDGIPGAWERIERISVDYAVMEKASDVYAVPLRAGWDDMGTWEAAARHRESRRCSARSAILLDSPGAVVFAADRLIALVGVPGVVVVDAPDALLIVSRERSEDVRRVVARLRADGRQDLL